MKKQILMLIMFIVVLTAVINISSCKKKDSDPKPTGNVITGCAKTLFVITFNSDWTMLKKDVKYSEIEKDTLMSNSLDAVLEITPNSAGCENNGSKWHFTFWNKDSTIVRDFDWFCPPNDTVRYTLK